MTSTKHQRMVRITDRTWDLLLRLQLKQALHAGGRVATAAIIESAVVAMAQRAKIQEQV